jgi:hypothetical protein
MDNNRAHEIAKQSREIDFTGDYVLSISEIEKMINNYGKELYYKGQISGTNNPIREDMGK